MFDIGQETNKWSLQSNLFSELHSELTSTNDKAKEIAFAKELNNKPIALIMTSHQTKGRGRGSHIWTDPQPGSALLSSWVFQLSRPPAPVTSCRIGLALEKALSSTWPWLHWSLKAPNDIYLNKQKVGGILLENLQQGQQNRLIIGIGLNVWQKPDLETATSIYEHLLSPALLSPAAWHQFLDRLLLELSLAISNSANLLEKHEQLGLLHVLNQNPNLNERYQDLDSEGNLILPSKKIHWLDL